MLILGVETATERVGCAIGGHEGVLALFEVTRGRRHAETLAPAIRFVCEQADVELSELGAIAVDVGPGLFTGMRVGIATAKTLAMALRIPVVPAVSLDLLAYPLRRAPGLIAAVIDARRGQLFYAFYRSVPGGVQRLGPLAVGSVDDLVGELAATSDEVLCVGDGALRHQAQLAEVRRVELAEQWLAYPSPAPLVQLAHARALREEWESADAVEPMYLRRPDAEINWSTRDAAVRS
ncbi:MAG TPA: tRNA (adenosine(37)-N6)-threonylcarbamoyltransferase complex dimerization subunit type 1 TsaB [Acidimicrobiales bacterium]|nr:tRNA (adenosine(37)-N6)-threonylcarbamoyltransferase complex dimerization subunit type 1 TsaB [Acidimicrobiales bacterium]